MKQICVIGVGYVGIVTAACFADLGNRVIALDINEEKIEGLRRGEMPIYEPGLKELVERNVRSGRLSFTTSYTEGLDGSEFVFIAVGTPSGVDGEADLRYVAAAARSIAENMNEPLVVVNKSTVPVGTGDWVADIIRSHQKQPLPFCGGLLPRVPARRLGHQRFHAAAPHGARLAGCRTPPKRWPSCTCRCAPPSSSPTCAPPR